MGQPVEPPRQDRESNALRDQEYHRQRPEVSRDNGNDQAGQAQSQHHQCLGNLGDRSAAGAGEVIPEVEVLHHRPAERQQPQRAVRRERVRVFIVVVGMAVMLDVDVPERREGDHGPDEEPRQPAEQPIRPAGGADRVMRGVVHDGEHHKGHRGVDRDRDPQRGPSVDIADRGKDECGQRAQEDCDGGQRQLGYRLAGIRQRMVCGGVRRSLVYRVDGRHSSDSVVDTRQLLHQRRRRL